MDERSQILAELSDSEVEIFLSIGGVMPPDVVRERARKILARAEHVARMARTRASRAAELEEYRRGRAVA